MKRLLLVACIALAVPAVAAARPAPVTWCGTDETSQNRVPDIELSSTAQVRFVYAIPSDGTDNFLATASGIATDAAWMDQFWQGQDPSRTPRFDRYPFPGCTNPFAQLDIGFLRLPNPAAYYSAGKSVSLRLDDDLRTKFPANEKTIVYYDSPVSDRNLCGVTDYLSESRGGDEGIVYVFPQSCELSPVGSGGSAEVAAHELLHNLGAVPDGAPNECAGSAAHACDSDSDIMAQFIQPGSTLDSVFLDVNHDDYYAHSANRWDVQDSEWLTHLPQFPLTLAVAGPGTLFARVGASQLPCGSGCTGLTLDNGATVSVTATPARGSALASWSGGCSGAARSCAFAVGSATTVTATFVKAALQVTTSIVGRGTVTSTPGGIGCPGACSAAFAAAPVKLAAKPANGWKFTGWSGACTGTGVCGVSATGTARASFSRR